MDNSKAISDQPALTQYPRTEGEQRVHDTRLPLAFGQHFPALGRFVGLEEITTQTARVWPLSNKHAPSLRSPFEFVAADKTQGSMKSSARSEEFAGTTRPFLVPVSRWSPDSDDNLPANEEMKHTKKKDAGAQPNESSSLGTELIDCRDSPTEPAARHGPTGIARLSGTAAELQALYEAGNFDIDAFTSSAPTDNSGNAQGSSSASLHRSAEQEQTTPFRLLRTQAPQDPNGGLQNRRMSGRGPSWGNISSSLDAPRFAGLFDGLPGASGTNASHGRKPTDPFVASADQGPATSPFADQLPAHLLLGVPPPSFPYCLPSIRNSDAHTPLSPSFSSFSPLTPPTAPDGRRLPTRIGLPIPPPSLSSVEGRLEHTAQGRAHLDAQKPVREEWIVTNAKRIVLLARQTAAAEKQYQRTNSKADYDAWIKYRDAFHEATDLDHCQEERRNMFMPEGMRARRVEEDVGGIGGLPGIGAREGRLLSFQEALMERVCAEVKHGHGERRAKGFMTNAQAQAQAEEEDDGSQVTAEMLAMLSKEERVALKGVLGARVEKKAGRKA